MKKFSTEILCTLIILGNVWCKKHVCLKAVDTDDQILLICSLDRLQNQIYFINPDGKKTAECDVPIPLTNYSKCICHSNCPIHQDLSKNMTFVRVNKNESYVYGNWTCNHGTNDGSDVFDTEIYHLTSSVRIFGPCCVHEEQLLEINCTSGDLSNGTSVEFLLNGVTMTNIIQHDNLCFNSYVGGICTPRICKCSSDRRSFVIFKKLTAGAKVVAFQCKMKFDNDKILESNILKVRIVEPPDVTLKNAEAHCNKSDTVTLVCKVEGGSRHYGFGQWEHKLDGTVIRTLEGVAEGKLSLLLIQSCSYQDAGEYVCKVWNSFDDGLRWTSRSTYLTVSDSTVFLEKSVYTFKSELVFSVKFYSTIDLVLVSWFKDNVPLPNSTEFQQILKTENLKIKLFEKLIPVKGYLFQLTTDLDSFPEIKCSVCITNRHSMRCEEFKGNKTTLNRQTENVGVGKIWIIIGVVSVALFFTVIAGAMILTICCRQRISRNQDSDSYNQTDVHSSRQAGNTVNHGYLVSNSSAPIIRSNALSTHREGDGLTEHELQSVYLDIVEGSEKSSVRSNSYEEVE